MKAEELIAKTPDLPRLSGSTLKVINLLNRPDSHASDVVESVQYDPVLSAKLLRVCNSACFARPEPVAAIDQAVFLLGYREVYRMVMALCFGGVLNRPLPAFAIDDGELWRHALITALAAEAVAGADATGAFEPPVAYTAGLLHDIGKLVLNQALTPVDLAAIRELAEREDVPRNEVERILLQTDHAEVGACLLRAWHVPEIIVEAVAHHHAPVVQPRAQLSALVHVANLAAHKLGSAPGWAAFGLRADAAAFQALGWDWDRFQSLLIEVHTTLERLEQYTTAA